MCTHPHTHMHHTHTHHTHASHTHTQRKRNTHIHTHTHTHRNTHTHTHTHTERETHTHTHRKRNTHTHTQRKRNTHKHTHTHRHTHTHTHTRVNNKQTQLTIGVPRWQLMCIPLICNQSHIVIRELALSSQAHTLAVCVAETAHTQGQPSRSRFHHHLEDSLLINCSVTFSFTDCHAQRLKTRSIKNHGGLFSLNCSGFSYWLQMFSVTSRVICRASELQPCRSG